MLKRLRNRVHLLWPNCWNMSQNTCRKVSSLGSGLPITRLVTRATPRRVAAIAMLLFSVHGYGLFRIPEKNVR